jgi:hypothetical protein
MQAKCRTKNPETYWVENLTPGKQHIEAELLCSGCPVIGECGLDVLSRIDVGGFVDGLWVRAKAQGVDVVDCGGVGVGSGVDVVPHSGVVRAGVVMEWDGTDE